MNKWQLVIIDDFIINNLRNSDDMSCIVEANSEKEARKKARRDYNMTVEIVTRSTDITFSPWIDKNQSKCEIIDIS